jgi:hypothetical protein
VLGVPDGAEVQVDDRPSRRTPLAEPLWSAVGTVVLTVRMPGYFPVARRVVVDAGGVARETVSLVPMQPVGTPTISPAAPQVAVPPRVEVRRVVPAATHPRRVLGIAGVIGGAAVLLGGASAHVARELTLDGAVRDGCALTAAGAWPASLGLGDGGWDVTFLRDVHLPVLVHPKPALVEAMRGHPRAVVIG